MLPWKEISGSAVSADPAWMPLSIDIVVGVLAAVLVFIGSLALGGFSFIEPWLVLCALAMFASGLMRGASPGNFVLKVLAIAASLLLLVAVLESSLADILTGSLVAVVPVTAGIALRRLSIHAHARKVARLTH
jgi:hypothetical protein